MFVCKIDDEITELVYSIKSACTWHSGKFSFHRQPGEYRKPGKPENLFNDISCCSKEAMDAKLCLCLMLIILGTLTVQGAIPRNNKKNPSEVFARQICECFFDPFMSTCYNFF